MTAVAVREENLRDRPIQAGEHNELLLSAAAGGLAGKGCRAP
jgi:hypothetical protein